MLRLVVAVILIGLMFAGGTLLHFLTTTFLFGLGCGLLLGMVLWVKVRWRKPAA